MIKKSQPARMQYENAYRHIRSGHHRTPGGMWDFISREAEEKAQETYYSKRSRFNGWIRGYRREIFYSLQCDRYPELGGIPF